MSKPLISHAITAPPPDIQDCLVKDMWDSNSGWKGELFADLLPPGILQIIDSFELQDDPEAIDKIFWNGSTSGGFSIKSALELIKCDEPALVNNKWVKVWRMKLSFLSVYAFSFG